MKITTDRKSFEDALKVVTNTVSGSDPGIRSHYVFRYENPGVVSVQTSHNRVFSSSLIACEATPPEGEGEGQFTVEAKRLRQWLSASPGDNLVFDYSSGVVKASSQIGSVTFKSLDARQFAWWDSVLAESKKTSDIDASLFADSLSFLRHFVSSDEERRPELCSCEVVNGLFLATDQASFAMLDIPELRKSRVRIHGKDIAQFCKFLSLSEGAIEVLEHDYCLLIRNSSGSVFGQSKSRHAFPTLREDLVFAYRDAKTKWRIPRASLITAIDFLSSSAVDGKFRTLIQRSTGGVNVSMESAAGGRVSLDIPCGPPDAESGVDSVPLNYRVLKQFLGNLPDEDVLIGIQRVSSGGYAAFDCKLGDSKALVVMGWYMSEDN